MMVFKKKESVEQKKDRLMKELAAAEKELGERIVVPEPPSMPDTAVHEMESISRKDSNGLVRVQSLVEELEKKYGVYPELGLSGHAHVERVLLLALVAELRALREELRGDK